MRLWDLVYLRLPNFSHSYTRHVFSFTQVMCLLFCQPVQTSHPLALVYFLLQRFMGFQKPVPTGFAPSQTTSTIWRTLRYIKQFEHVWACLSSCLHQFEHLPHHFTFAHAAHVSSAHAAPDFGTLGARHLGPVGDSLRPRHHELQLHGHRDADESPAHCRT